MCFTVNVNIIKEELESRYGSKLLDPEKYTPSYYYHAFAFPELPALFLDDKGERMLKPLKWGLIPGWVSSSEEADKIRKMTPNARSESILEKPSFSESFKARRCIIPISGFYEWQHLPSGKRPWYIQSKDENVMALAGIFDRWEDHESTAENRKEIYSFSVLTTEANSLMADIHNSKKRMPVIIPAGYENDWMSLPVDELKHFFDPIPSTDLNAHTVSPTLGSPKVNRNRIESIAPYHHPEEPTLF